MLSDTSTFSKLTDEDLVKLSRDGNQNAETVIFERYKKSVRSTAEFYHSRYSAFCLLGLLDIDDIYQEGLLGLLSAIYSFRPEKNVTFRTYSAKCISNSIKAALKTATSKKNIPVGTAVPLDDIEIPSPVSVVDSLIDDEDTQALNRFLQTELSALEHSVLRLFLAEYSYRQISEALGIAEKSVDNAIQRIRGKINRFLDKNRS